MLRNRFSMPGRNTTPVVGSQDRPQVKRMQFAKTIYLYDPKENMLRTLKYLMIAAMLAVPFISARPVVDWRFRIKHPLWRNAGWGSGVGFLCHDLMLYPAQEGHAKTMLHSCAIEGRPFLFPSPSMILLKHTLLTIFLV